MSNINKVIKRGSGRTTRILLQAAIKISNNPDKIVLVFAYNYSYADELCKKLFELCQYCGIPIVCDQFISKSYQGNVTENFTNKIIVEDHF